jgi:hypothetical protein
VKCQRTGVDMDLRADRHRRRDDSADLPRPADPADAIASALSRTIVDPIGFVMERKTLVGISKFAEGGLAPDALRAAIAGGPG